MSQAQSRLSSRARSALQPRRLRLRGVKPRGWTRDVTLCMDIAACCPNEGAEACSSEARFTIAVRRLDTTAETDEMTVFSAARLLSANTKRRRNRDSEVHEGVEVDTWVHSLLEFRRLNAPRSQCA